MSDLYLLRCDQPWHIEPEYDDGGEPHYIECMKPVEPVGVVEMVDHIDGWFTVSNVYAPDLPEASYRVAIVIVEADDE